MFSGCSGAYLVKKTSRGLNNYVIDAIIDVENKTVDANESLNYENNTGQALSEMKFNLYPVAFSQGVTNKPVSSLNEENAYPNGVSYGDIEIDKVEINDKAVNYFFEGIDKDILVVNFENDLKQNKSVNIDIDFSLTLPNIKHRFGYSENAINLGNFYPIACIYENGEFVTNSYSPNGDPFYSELSNYLVKLTYPGDYILANTGVKTNTENKEGNNKTTMKALAVRDFAMVLSDKFEVKIERVGNTDVYYYYHNDGSSDRSLQAAVDSIKTFEDMIGDYPYDSFSVVQTSFVHGGMEYPGLVYVSDELNNYEDYINVIVHETAHQWWYGMVGSDAFKNGWLDEGLTEYTTALFYERNPQYDIKLENIIGNAKTAYTMFVDVYEQIFGQVDTSLTRSLNEYDTEPEYVYMAYVKGMLLFDNVRSVVGDKRFFKAIKYYFEVNKFKNTNPDELINCFEKSTNRNLEGLLNSWIDGTVIIKEAW